MTDIVVVGAGVVGLAAAWALRRRGADVLVIERESPGGGASSGNAGWIVPSYSTPVPAPGLIGRSARWMLRRDSPLYVRPRLNPAFLRWTVSFARACRPGSYQAGLDALANLNARTMTLYDTLRADGVEFEMESAGLLFAGLSPEAVEHAAEELAFLESLGYQPIRVLDGEQLRSVEPMLSDRVAGGFHIASERHVRPETLTAGLANWLTYNGVEIRSDVSARRLNARRGNVTIETTGGAIVTGRVLVAAGAWSRDLLARSGVALPLEAGKGYSITWSSPPWQLRQPVDLIEAHVACTPFAGALRLAGTMEISGLNDRVIPERVAALRKAGRQYFRAEPAGTSERVWVGPRPLLPDGLPAIGNLSKLPNVYLATGHAMLGVTLAPATAELIADLVLGDPKAGVNNPFDPARFNC